MDEVAQYGLLHRRVLDHWVGVQHMTPNFRFCACMPLPRISRQRTGFMFSTSWHPTNGQCMSYSWSVMGIGMSAIEIKQEMFSHYVRSHRNRGFI